jgi:twitching motility two-component system response regulator PilG
MDSEGNVQEDCSIVILNTENREAKAHWRTLSERLTPPTAVLYANTPPEDSGQLYLLRPLGPAKILSVLDAATHTLREVEQILTKPVNGAKPANGKDAEMFKVAAGLRALVVDDSPTVCKQLELELQNFNIQADIAETAEMGLVMLAQRKYDLIFLDVVLPLTDGYQACKEIRKNPKTKHTPIIMLTSKSSPFDRVRGSLAGCSTYLTKPVDYNMFRHTIEKYVGTHVAIRARS